MTSDYKLTLADKVIVALLIKQRCEKLSLFDQLCHQFLFLLRIGHFL